MGHDCKISMDTDNPPTSTGLLFGRHRSGGRGGLLHRSQGGGDQSAAAAGAARHGILWDFSRQRGDMTQIIFLWVYIYIYSRFGIIDIVWDFQ